MLVLGNSGIRGCLSHLVDVNYCEIVGRSEKAF